MLQRRGSCSDLEGIDSGSNMVVDRDKLATKVLHEKLALNTSESTAGLDAQYEPTKNQFQNEPEGLRQFQDHHRKAFGEENPNILGPILYDHFLASYFSKDVKNGPQQTWTRKNWIRLVKYSSAEVSDPSEVPRFVRELIFC